MNLCKEAEIFEKKKFLHENFTETFLIYGMEIIKKLKAAHSFPNRLLTTLAKRANNFCKLFLRIIKK